MARRRLAARLRPAGARRRGARPGPAPRRGAGRQRAARAARGRAGGGRPGAVPRGRAALPVRRRGRRRAGAVTVANACSAGGHVLALAQDMIELGEADAVVVAATDAMTESMLAMIGRVADEPADRVRPFDRDRAGVLLGEGPPRSW
ncbi:beta-ketoacyl synthase N-terminal-like domain-containing protein [Micromonospora sp. BRA006-A]|nr:beta-ketoacyl synthase N-terminal-like domain-containing protein [Micromonospora sp. BRA006-A]